MKFPTEEELRKMNMTQLKKHVREMNEHYGIKGYSKLRKDQLINAIMTSQLRISKGETKPTKPATMKPSPKGKSILESKLKQKVGRPAKTTTKAKKKLMVIE